MMNQVVKVKVHLVNGCQMQLEVLGRREGDLESHLHIWDLHSTALYVPEPQLIT
jgi:hypothetical protein